MVWLFARAARARQSHLGAREGQLLFNSYAFVFGFLPVTVIGFLLLGRHSRTSALDWLIFASVFFYAWWRPFNLLIIASSLLANYIFARTLLRLAADKTQQRACTIVLSIGITFNLLLLGYFKYANFGASIVNDVAGTDFILEQIVLPLGISFITFQKIAFLMDVAGGRVKSFTPRELVLFVMFFPQLIAGPIVHFREMMPQFKVLECRFNPELFAVGLTLFCFGLFKKTVLADGIAQYVTPIYAHAAAGGDVTLLQAWQAAVGFTLQIYFDFSAYSDMACGAALLFGIRLPMNFDSPLQATNIIDFWSRWHITLTRFLTAYVYNPVALSVTRRRAAAGKPLLRGRASSFAAYMQVLVAPTVFTMLVSGVWHGAGYTFVIWGLIHGVYLAINHAWRQYGPKAEEVGSGRGALPLTLLGGGLTFVAVAVAMVFFRAPDVHSAINIVQGMAGLNGISLPNKLSALIGLSELPTMMLNGSMVYGWAWGIEVASLLALLVIAFFMPNTLQMLAPHNPAIQLPPRPSRIAILGWEVHWQLTPFWTAVVVVLAAVAIWRLQGESEFLYWQF